MASKNRKNKVKFKWTKELIILICCLVAMITATIVMSIPSKHATFTKEMNTAISAADSSASLLTDKNVIYKVSHKDLKKKVAKEEYVVVIYGSLTDTSLVGNLSTINSTALNLEKKVYFYSSDWVIETEDTDTADFKEKATKLGSDFKYGDAQEFDYLKYPAILVFHDGKIVLNTQEYDDNESYNWNMYINKALMLSFETKAE